MPKQLQGKVVSNKMQKTLVVEVTTMRAHPLYGKQMKRSNRFKVHSEDKNIKLGDIIRIVETRPMSKEKRWKVMEEEKVKKG